MAKTIGKNINTTDTANVLSPISVDSTTSVTLLAAQVEGDDERIKVIVTNNGNKTLWVKPQAAAIDNDKKGERVAPGESRLILEQGDNYSDEISAIFDSGGAKDVIVVSL